MVVVWFHSPSFPNLDRLHERRVDECVTEVAELRTALTAAQPMLTLDEALRSYAAMMNRLDADQLAPLLADDFHYASQWVFAEMTSSTSDRSCRR
jgi:hypothetical protein